jgi:hypothetical protein
MYFIQHCFIFRPSDSTVSEDAGIEPRTVATLALTVRRSNHSAKPHQNDQNVVLTLEKFCSSHGNNHFFSTSIFHFTVGTTSLLLGSLFGIKVTTRKWNTRCNLDPLGYSKGYYKENVFVFPSSTEIEFLDFKLTKDLSLLLHAIHSPFYCRL